MIATRIHEAEPTILSLDDWSARAADHRERVRRWTDPYRDRRARGMPHPVHDFLFQYYRYSMGKLEEWHPDPCEALEDSPQARERFASMPYAASGGRVFRDRAYLDARDRARLGWIRDFLQTTGRRTPHFGCYGMHEWAMVYRGDGVRHEGVVPLRMSQTEVDELVEQRPIACSHFDAFRFFAPDARALNRIQPSEENRDELEQPGCIHANMDLYKRAYRSMPWIGSRLLWDSFQLASRLRSLDMRASPYDLRSLGFQPIEVETPEGRCRYAAEQRALADEASTIRDRLVDTLTVVLSRVC